MIAEQVMENKEDAGKALTRRERRRQRDREEIMAAAATLFADSGYHRTSMQAIAEQADFSVGKLYTFFAGKEAILEEILTRFEAGLLALVDQEDDPATDPLARLRRRLVAVFSFANRNPQLVRVGILERRQAAGRPDRGALDGLVSKLEAILEEAVAQRLLPPLNAPLLALMIGGACEGLAVGLGGRDVSDPFTPIPELVMTLMIQPLVRRQEDIHGEPRP
jgi:AcrR family transcriptional regulator